MTCLDCHDPHAPDNRARMDALDGLAGNRVCIKCHTKYDKIITVKTHNHHKTYKPNKIYMNYHIPRKNMSLDTHLTHYHRISSPTDRARVEGDQPLKYALCHPDRTIGSLIKTIKN